MINFLLVNEYFEKCTNLSRILAWKKNNIKLGDWLQLWIMPFWNLQKFNTKSTQNSQHFSFFFFNWCPIPDCRSFHGWHRWCAKIARAIGIFGVGFGSAGSHQISFDKECRRAQIGPIESKNLEIFWAVNAANFIPF